MRKDNSLRLCIVLPQSSEANNKLVKELFEEGINKKPNKVCSSAGKNKLFKELFAEDIDKKPNKVGRSA